MTSGGRLTGVLALGSPPVAPAIRRELLLIEAFANRIADIIASGSDPAALRLALQRFKASWTETLDGWLSGVDRFEPVALGLDQDRDAADVAELEDLADARCPSARRR